MSNYPIIYTSNREKNKNRLNKKKMSGFGDRRGGGGFRGRGGSFGDRRGGGGGFGGKIHNHKVLCVPNYHVEIYLRRWRPRIWGRVTRRRRRV